MTPIPLFDCRLSAEVLAALQEPFERGHLAAGPAVPQLEQAFAARYPERHAVAVGDMTHGLMMALQLAGVRPGDEVLSLAFNCMSSNSAIAMSGANVSWVDVDPVTATFDIEHAQAHVTSRTRAVVVYHVSGYPADLAQLRAFCDDQNLPLIEDANNAFGAVIDGKPIGSVGDFAVFSLYANRQINAIDGGILLCARAADADRARRLRRFGIDVARFRDSDGEIDAALDVSEIGTSSSLNNVNATIAAAGLADVDRRIARSRRNAAALTSATRNLAVVPIFPLDRAEPAYWTWLIRLDERDGVMRALKAKGISCSRLHHPNNHYTAFHRINDDLPGTATLERELLAIPCGWWLDEAAIERIVAALTNAVGVRR